MNLTIIRHSIRNRGGDRIVLDYAAYLAQKGHAVTYWTNQIDTRFKIDPRIQMKPIPWPGRLGTLFFALTQKFNTDIVLVDLIVMGIAASFRNRKRVVYFAQDYDVSYYSSRALQGFIHFCYEFAFKTLHLPTISESEMLSRELIQHKSPFIKTVPNGVDLDKFYPEVKSHVLSTRKDTQIILLFVRKDYRKGLDIAIKALKKLTQILPPNKWEVWTIGQTLSSEDSFKVKNLGFLNEEMLRDAFIASDVYFFASRHEGLSTLLLQALACGCAVVGTESTQIITPHENGLISPLNDWEALAQNLKNVLTDPELRSRLKNNAYLLAQQYSLKKSMAGFEAALKACLNYLREGQTPAATSPPRIVTVRHSIRNRGGDRCVLDYLNHLSEQLPEVIHYASKVKTSFMISQKVKIKKIPIPGRLGTVLFTCITKLDAEIVMVDLAVMAFLANIRNHKKVLFLAQDYDVSYYRSPFLRGITHLAYYWIFNFQTTQTVAVSEGLSQVLQRYHPRHLRVIPHGIDVNVFKKNGQTPYGERKQSPHVILFFARDDYRKGTDIAMRAISHLHQCQEKINWEVWVIGERKIVMPGIRITNLGFVTDEKELADILSAVDIFLVASRSEGLGLLCLQALACSCALVATSAVSIITHEVNGLVSPIEDWKALAQNMKRVLEDPELALRLKKAGRALAEQYDIRVSKKKFAEFIETFTSQPS